MQSCWELMMSSKENPDCTLWGNFLRDCIRDLSFLLFLLHVSIKACLSLRFLVTNGLI